MEGVGTLLIVEIVSVEEVDFGFISGQSSFWDSRFWDGGLTGMTFILEG